MQTPSPSHEESAGMLAHAALLRASAEVLHSAEPGRAAEDFLADLAQALSARRVLWVEAGDGPLRIRGEEARGRTIEGLDESLWRGLGTGQVRRLATDRLARSARFLRLGARQLTLCCEAKVGLGLRLLWIESVSELSATDEELRSAAASAARLFELAKRLTSIAEDETLKRRGVAALAMVHDLRHQLSLATLCAQRARETEAEEAENLLSELDRALSKARAISADALGDPRSENEAPALTRLYDLLQEEARAVGRLGLDDGRLGGRVAIALRCPKGLRVRTSHSTLSRLVRNLLLNAYKASSAGARVLLSAQQNSAAVLIRIEDSGRGMDARRVRKLFTSDRTNAGGAGCGTLSILASIEQLGARLEVESAPGRGTRVNISLPVHAGEGGDESQACILLVDGHRARRARRVAALEARSSRVLAVALVSEALLELEREKPAMILVERGLPSVQLELLTERARELECELRTLAFRDTGA